MIRYISQYRYNDTINISILSGSIISADYIYLNGVMLNYIPPLKNVNRTNAYSIIPTKLHVQLDSDQPVHQQKLISIFAGYLDSHRAYSEFSLGTCDFEMLFL